MKKWEYKIDNSSVVKKSNEVLIRIIKLSCLVVFFVSVIIFSFFFIKKVNSTKLSVSSIKKAWSVYDYQSVYELSKSYLDKKSFNNTALTYYGYACFYLAQSEIEPTQAQKYLDECIRALRIAMYSASKSLLPQLQYMLGRAYFYKNTLMSHYYSDLTIKYLLLAKENGYKSDDIAEYLGLSYANLGMTLESISSFTEALLVRESDSLLLAIAEQYYKSEQKGAAKQYLFRIVNTSENDELVCKSRILLGKIYLDEEDFDSALKEFENVLKKNQNSADAHYGIGVIYEKQGNVVKARAEWRNALKIQVNHPDALQKISEYK